MEHTKRALLFAAFGVSDPAAAETTITPILTAAAGRWPDRRVALAYTSERVRKALKLRHGVEVDSVPDGLKRLFYDGFGQIIVQPLLMADGKEYRKLLEQVMVFQMHYPEANVRLEFPLLWTSADVAELADVLRNENYVSAVKTGGQADVGENPECAAEKADQTRRCVVVYVGHGVEAGAEPLAGSDEANRAYRELAAELEQRACENGSGVRSACGDIIIGTLKGEPGFAEVVKQLNRKIGAECSEERRTAGENMCDCAKRPIVILKPLMLMAGVHAKKDIAGTDADSWKSQLEVLGYEVRCKLTGLGEDPAVRELFLKRAAQAMDDAPWK